LELGKAGKYMFIIDELLLEIETYPNTLDNNLPID
jgi:hypothetical protein